MAPAALRQIQQNEINNCLRMSAVELASLRPHSIPSAPSGSSASVIPMATPLPGEASGFSGRTTEHRAV